MLMSLTTERDPLIASFCNIAEQSFFAYAEAADPAPDDLTACGEWLVALVHFAGPACGSLTVGLPLPLALELCGAFLGSGPEDGLEPTAVDDFAGELANMAVGAWLTDSRRADCFALSHPEVTRTAQPPVDPLVWMSCNGQPVALTLTEEPRRA